MVHLLRGELLIDLDMSAHVGLFLLKISHFSKFRFGNPERDYKGVVLTVRRGSSPFFCPHFHLHGK